MTDSATIAGLLFSLVGAEPAGFDIDNVEFGVGSQVIVPGTTPVPGALPLFGTGLGILGLLSRRRKPKERRSRLTRSPDRISEESREQAV